MPNYCAHVWDWRVNQMYACQKCGLERAELEGTVCVAYGATGPCGVLVEALDGGDLVTLLLPFTERRVRITVEPAE